MSLFLLVSLGFMFIPLVLICLTELLGRCKLLAVLTNGDAEDPGYLGNQWILDNPSWIINVHNGPEDNLNRRKQSTVVLGNKNQTIVQRKPQLTGLKRRHIDLALFVLFFAPYFTFLIWYTFFLNYLAI